MYPCVRHTHTHEGGNLVVGPPAVFGRGTRDSPSATVFFVPGIGQFDVKLELAESKGPTGQPARVMSHVHKPLQIRVIGLYYERAVVL
jgi:hypothetical protein